MNEAKDSLQSKATLSILDLLGEGPIGGLVNGLKTVYLNDTPIENADGTKNFQGLSWDIRGGGNTQPVMPSFGNYVEAPFTVGAQVKTTTPYTFTVSNPNADAVRVIVTIPSLTVTNADNGDISGSSVQYKFSMSVNGGPFVDQIADTIYQGAATWTLEGGSETATGVAGAVGVKASVTASTTQDTGTITVQAQELNGAIWQNLGAARRLNVNLQWQETYFGGDGYYGEYVPVGDSYTVESNFRKVRFVIVSRTSNTISLSRGAAISRVGTSVVTVTGKSRSRYQRNHVLKVPQPNNSVQIRMTRITADTTTALLQNDTILDSYSEIVTLNMVYPNSAIFGLRVDSQQFNQIPNRSYLVNGLYIRVPSNYNATTRAYTGVWNGSFQYAVSNNPAWILFDVLTNKRYGLGNFIEDSQVDKAMLYTIGRYCDGLVPNGFGGTEPRFTLNTVISSQAEAFKFISDISSVFRGMGFWDGGMVNFTQDAPTDPSMLYTSANVIDGAFSYTGSARKDRHSIVHVTWNDPEDLYKQKVEYVEDRELVNLYGVKKLDTLAFGCTSRGQAARVGKWILYTEKYESDFITFKVGVDSAFVMPGNVVKIHDTTRAGRRVAGRLQSATTTSATLDNPVTITSTGTSISLMMPDGTFADRTIFQSDGIHTTVTWATALTQLPVENALWMISEPNLVPILARVIGITQGENPSEYEITALEHNPTKFGAIELGLTLEDRKTSILDPNFVQVPTQINAIESIYKAAPGVFANKLFISWFGNSTQYDFSYRGVSASNASNWTNVRVTDGLSYEILNAALGTYEIAISGINPLGKRSTSATATYTVLGKRTPPSDVTNFAATANSEGVALSWVAIPDEDFKFYEIRQCAFPGQGWEDATMIAQPYVAFHQGSLLSQGTYEWLIRAVDSNFNLSAVAARASVTIAAPSAVSVSYAYALSDIVVSWPAAAAGSFPIKHYILKRGETWGTATDLGLTSDTSYKTPIKWASTQKIWVAAVDIADNIATPAFVSAVFSTPAAPVVTHSQKTTNFILEWTEPSASLAISAYEVRFGSSFAGGTKVGTISGTQLTIPITWLGSRTFWVAGIDLNGNVGAAGSRALTVLAPRAPASFGTSYNQSQVTISWADSTETLPIDFYEVRRGADWSTGVLVGKAYTNTLSLEVSWADSATFTVRATDINGNQGPSGTYINTIGAPGSVSVAHQFKDGNAILTWAAPSTGSLPIRHYEIREGVTWATASLVGITSDRLYSIPVNWTSSKTFWVAAVDTAGSYGTAGSRVVTFIKYDAPTNLSAAVSQASVTLSWQSAANGSLDISYYDIRHGADWDTGEIIGKVNTTTITLPITWLGDRKLWVAAVDTNKQFGAATSLISSVSAPGAPSVSSTVVVAKAELTWTAPSASLPIREYEIRHGASWAAGTVVATTLSTTYRAPIEWLGNRTYWIVARDVNGNVGVAGSTVVSIAAPTAPTVSGAFALDEFKLNWIDPTSTLPIDEYEIRYGATWAAGTVLGRVKGTTISTKAQWLGSRTWWVAGIDVNGNVGAAGSAALTITAPPKPSLTQQVVDNNVLLYWSQPSGTLPVVTNELRRGPTWATAEPIGQKAGGFTTVFETVAGTYTYWVAGVDSAGNVGTPGDVTTSVSQPPDYALKANDNSTFGGTKSNMYLDTDGSYILPVNTTETFEQHFTSRAWTTPNAQIAAGYPVFIQPANSPGYYEEVIDYGTAIGGTKITVTPTGSVVAGNPAITINVSVKLNAGDAWTDYNGISSVFVNNFRYVKVRLTVTGDNLSLYRITKLNVKLDTKIRNEAGMSTAGATDAVSGTNAIINGVSLTGVNPNNSFGVRVPDGAGTMIRFSTPFIDVTAVEISPAAGSSARYGLYDFVDTPNAAGFKVLLYDGAGNRVGGTFSWSVKGY